MIAASGGEVTETGVGESPAQPHANAQSVPPTQAAADPAKQRRLTNGTNFLNNAAVKASPLNRRVNFLKSKGLSAEEIVECFERAGQPQTLDAIKSLISGTAAGGAAAAHVAAPPAAQPTTQAQALYAANPNYQQPPPAPYSQQQQYHAPLPHAPQPPPLPPRSEKWKDYVIAAGAASLAVVGAFKAFEHFSPFEVRRKSSTSTTTSSSSRSNRRVSSAAPAQQMSSGESEGVSDVRRRLPQASLPLVPQPQTQPAAAATSTGLTVDTAASQQALTEVQEKVTALEKELADAKAALDKERREKAELAVSNGKMKGQLTTLSRQNEKNVTEVTRLTNELLSLRVTRDKEEADRLLQVVAGSAASSVVSDAPATATPATADAADPASNDATATATGGALETVGP